jgi:hypothetical protein
MINTFRIPDEVGKDGNALRKDAISARFSLGNPAVCVRPVAFRPCLATGLTFLTNAIANHTIMKLKPM